MVGMFKRFMQALIILALVWGAAYATGRTTLGPVPFTVALLSPVWTAAQSQWAVARGWWGYGTPEVAVHSAAQKVEGVKCLRELLPPDAQGAVGAAESTASRVGAQVGREVAGRDLGFTDECLLRR